MTYNIKGVKVIDGYFPDWIVDDVAQWITEYCPMSVSYTHLTLPTKA